MIVIGVIVSLLFLVVVFSSIKSKQEYYSSQSDKIRAIKKRVEDE